MYGKERGRDVSDVSPVHREGRKEERKEGRKEEREEGKKRNRRARGCENDNEILVES